MAIDLNNINKGDGLGAEKAANNANTRINALAGFGQDYGQQEARLALALSDAGLGGGGGGGGGGGATAAEIQTAMINALQSQNQVEFQEIVLQDADQVLFISSRQINEETGAVTVTTRKLDGTNYMPVSPVTLPVNYDEILNLQGILANTNLTTYHFTSFWALEDGTDYLAGDEIVRKVSLSEVVTWYNVRTNANIGEPLNIVANLRDCKISFTLNSVANIIDNPILAGPVALSSLINIPIIGGKKANRVLITKTSNITASPLYPNDNGFLWSIDEFGNGGAVLLTDSASKPRLNINNLQQIGIIEPQMASIGIRNWNTSVNTFDLKFYYDDNSVTKDYTYPYSFTSWRDLTASTPYSLSVPSNVTNRRIGFQINGATTNVVFRLSQSTTINGTTAFRPIDEYVIPLGVTSIWFNNENGEITRTGNLSINVVSGTFTNYGFTLEFNN